MGLGLAAREPEPEGVLDLAPAPTILIRRLLPVGPSDISPPVASPSLSAPAPEPLLAIFGLCWPGSGVVDRLGRTEPLACFLTFLREDSLPLDSERFGEPGRLRDLPFFETASDAFCLPWGVVLPFGVPPADGFSFSLPSVFAFWSSSFFSPSASSFSSSSLCRQMLVTRALHVYLPIE